MGVVNVTRCPGISLRTPRQIVSGAGTQLWRRNVVTARRLSSAANPGNAHKAFSSDPNAKTFPTQP